MLLVAACCASRQRTGAVVPEKVAPERQDVALTELADIERVLCAHQIAPSESLAVRLVGTIGPNGSWALDRVDVERSADGVLITPHVRRVAGDNFIQMVMPLDRVERVMLPAGTHRVRVRGRERTLEEVVRVEPGVLRAAPEVTLRSAPAVQQGDLEIVNVNVIAHVADGFVARVEVREVVGAGAGAWQPPSYVQTDGDSTVAVVTVRRPAGDRERRIDVMAIDGQGGSSKPPASLLLPAR